MPVPDPGRLTTREGAFSEVEFKPKTGFLQGPVYDKETPRPPTHTFHKGSSQIHEHFQRTSLIPVAQRSSVAR